ncbi:hypothetical protein SKAU_G00375490 [Synaphobranchus kaupii]|uniref:Uncharacterized protein n=1 Tax=Synaphobranchus kaupii TaxID=118154 RepID=A0A9Q1EGV8_SYNKA|nr:hypothetical protein SKAU_G00375490 [Synaphobranchus kaupii]
MAVPRLEMGHQASSTPPRESRPQWASPALRIVETTGMAANGGSTSLRHVQSQQPLGRNRSLWPTSLGPCRHVWLHWPREHRAGLMSREPA